MKALRSVFARIWAGWAVLVFVSTMLIFLIPFLLFCYFRPEPSKTYRFVAYIRVWMTVFLNLIGCPLTIRGRSNFQKGENYIVLCNHNSLIDVPVSSPSIPGGNKTIAKTEMARIPLFGLLYKTGSVLVDRKSDASRKESFSKMKAVLAMGLHMCIYPEGTRNKTKEPLKPFHSGAFRLSIDSGKSIIPALIFNSRRVLPADKSFYLLPHPLAIHFLPPVKVEQADTPDSLRQRVAAIMSEYYLKQQGN